MFKRNNRPVNMMRIAGPCRPGTLIPKPSVGLFRRKKERFYNYTEQDGRPYGADFERDVPCDQYHLRMLAKGDVRLVDTKRKKSPAPTVEAKKSEVKNGN